VFVNSLFDWSCAWDFTSTSSIGAVIESLSFFHIFLIRKKKKYIYIYIYEEIQTLYKRTNRRSSSKTKHETYQTKN
jgi:hypothetical protein